MVLPSVFNPRWFLLCHSSLQRLAMSSLSCTCVTPRKRTRRLQKKRRKMRQRSKWGTVGARVHIGARCCAPFTCWRCIWRTWRTEVMLMASCKYLCSQIHIDSRKMKQRNKEKRECWTMLNTCCIRGAGLLNMSHVTGISCCDFSRTSCNWATTESPTFQHR